MQLKILFLLSICIGFCYSQNPFMLTYSLNSAGSWQTLVGGVCTYNFVLKVASNSDTNRAPPVTVSGLGVNFTYIITNYFAYTDGETINYWQYTGTISSTEVGTQTTYSFFIQNHVIGTQTAQNTPFFVSPLTCVDGTITLSNFLATSPTSLIANSNSQCTFNSTFSLYLNGNSDPLDQSKIIPFNGNSAFSLYSVRSLGGSNYEMTITTNEDSFSSNTITYKTISPLAISDIQCLNREPYPTEFNLAVSQVNTSTGECSFSFTMEIESGDLVDLSQFDSNDGLITVVGDSSNSFTGKLVVGTFGELDIIITYGGSDFIGGSSSISFPPIQCHGYSPSVVNVSFADTRVTWNSECVFDFSIELNTSHVEYENNFSSSIGSISDSGLNNVTFSGQLIIPSSGFYQFDISYYSLAFDHIYNLVGGQSGVNGSILECYNANDPYITNFNIDSTAFTVGPNDQRCTINGNITIFYLTMNINPSASDISFDYIGSGSGFINNTVISDPISAVNSVSYNFTFDVPIGNLDIDSNYIIKVQDHYVVAGGITTYNLPNVDCKEKEQSTSSSSDSSDKSGSSVEKNSDESNVNSANTLKIYSILIINVILLLILSTF